MPRVHVEDRGSQAPPSVVTGGCECGDLAAQGQEWDSPNLL